MTKHMGHTLGDACTKAHEARSARNERRRARLLREGQAAVAILGHTSGGIVPNAIEIDGAKVDYRGQVSLANGERLTPDGDVARWHDWITAHAGEIHLTACRLIEQHLADAAISDADEGGATPAN